MPRIFLLVSEKDPGGLWFTNLHFTSCESANLLSTGLQNLAKSNRDHIEQETRRTVIHPFVIQVLSPRLQDLKKTHHCTLRRKFCVLYRIQERLYQLEQNKRPKRVVSLYYDSESTGTSWSKTEYRSYCFSGLAGNLGQRNGTRHFKMPTMHIIPNCFNIDWSNKGYTATRYGSSN